MKTQFTRIVVPGLLAVALAASSSAGLVSASSGSTTGTADGCAEITALLDAGDQLDTAFFSEDGDAVAEILGAFPDLSDAAITAAPPEIAETVSLAMEPLADIQEATEGVDLTDLDALFEAVASLPEAPESDEAFEDVETWAAENCGWVSSSVDPFADPPEPQACDTLDAAVAAEAAGLDIDVTDSDGGADVNLGIFWTKSCSYGNGRLSLSTFTFHSLDAVLGFYMDNLVDSDGNEIGEVLDVDLGSLPESSLATTVGGSITVSVFEATVPFSVSVTDEGVDAAAVVAAAEAVFAGLPDEVPPPPTTEALDEEMDDDMAPATTEG